MEPLVLKVQQKMDWWLQHEPVHHFRVSAKVYSKFLKHLGPIEPGDKLIYKGKELVTDEFVNNEVTPVLIKEMF